MWIIQIKTTELQEIDNKVSLKKLINTEFVVRNVTKPLS